MRTSSVCLSCMAMSKAMGLGCGLVDTNSRAGWKRMLAGTLQSPVRAPRDVSILLWDRGRLELLLPRGADTEEEAAVEAVEEELMGGLLRVQVEVAVVEEAAVEVVEVVEIGPLSVIVSSPSSSDWA